MCTVVKPISWLVHKASTSPKAPVKGQARQLLDDLRDFSQTRELDIVAIMTAFAAADGQFQRELLVWAVNIKNNAAEDAVKRFAEQFSKDLKLENWSGNESVTVAEQIHSQLNNDASSSPVPGWRRLWRQMDLTKSRKQVAPLLRKAITQ
jgi:DHHA2 domain.